MNSYIEKQWKQPVLTANGTLGGSSFAVKAKDYQSNSDATVSGDAWYAFAGSKKYWRSATNPSYIIIYNPIALKINKIYCTAGNTSTNSWGTLKSGTISGSNDNSSWTKIKDFTNNTFGAYTITVNSPAFYKYYKLEGTANNSAIHLSMKIDATYQENVTLSDMNSTSEKIQATDINSISNNIETINASTGNTVSFTNTEANTGSIIKSIDINKLQEAITNLNTNFNNNCCQQNYNDCCETCQGCQYCETCQACQSCQNNTCQSSSCQSSTCQSCQTCQSSTCQSQCRNSCNCSSNCRESH